MKSKTIGITASNGIHAWQPAEDVFFFRALENAIVISKNPRYNTIVVAIVDMVL